MESDEGQVRYTLLAADPPGTGPCCLGPACPPRELSGCRLSWHRQLALGALLIAAVVLVTYQGLWSGRAPARDVFLELEEAGTGAPDEVWDKIRIKHTKRRLPQCLIIGIRKAGTRALLAFLNLHPQIQTAKNEVHFFDEEDAYAQGYEWYRKRMPYSFPGQITIEKSPAYFKSRGAPGRVHSMNSTIKLLLIVRDPTERAVSDYLQLHIKRLSRNKPSPPFEVLAMTPEGEVDDSYSVLRLSLYYKHMRNWLEHFSMNQFHVVDGEQLAREPLRELRAVERFLGLEHRIDRSMLHYNASKGFYCVQNSSEERCLDHTKGRKHPDVDPLVIHKLRKFFAPYNKIFFEMIGRKFNWPVE